MLKKKKTIVLRAESDLSKQATIEALFSNYKQIKKAQSQRILRAFASGRVFNLPVFGPVPIMRYVPSRHLMQRMVVRAAQLPVSFTGFDRDNNMVNRQRPEPQRALPDNARAEDTLDQELQYRGVPPLTAKMHDHQPEHGQ